MPIYEFLCKSCGYEFEEFMHIDQANPMCSECNGETIKKISNFCGIVKSSENRTIDCIVGEDADRRRKILEKRREKRKELNKT